MKYHPMPFGRLAMLYYPDKSYKSAVRLFRQEILLTKGMLKALQKAGYKGYERLLTRKQVRIIEDFLGPTD